MDKIKAFSVGQVNEYIKSLLEDDFLLSDLFVEAEISNFKRHTSGHLYFTLKDDYAAINCIMFKGDTYGLTFEPENGAKVVAYGRVSLYEKTGQYQLYVTYLCELGVGGLAEKFEKLKTRLATEGLFDERYKKQIHTEPKCVAVITSQTGAVIRDILQIAKRRNPQVKIVIYPVSVQGAGAEMEIANALNYVNEWANADTIIVGRGGGSTEDLWAFNGEVLARAIFRSKIPVISAIGHETDFTIADFVADMRAPTPSAAAELAFPLLVNQKEMLRAKVIELNRAMQTEIDNKRERKNNLQNRLLKEMEYRLGKMRIVFQSKLDRLESVSPMGVLRRGYALPYKDGVLVKSVEQVKPNDCITINLLDGRIEATVNKV